MEKCYNLKEAADLLCVKVTTVRKWVREGKLKANKLAEADRWIVYESEIKRVRGEK